MKYRDSKNKLDTPKKILKVNHAGECGAINIYRSQILFSKLFYSDLVPLLESFKRDEERHRDVFWAEIKARNGVRCKSYWLCGLGGFVMGVVSSFLGRRGIMACTWAVESVVIYHLQEQIIYLESKGDSSALNAVQSILEDEQSHRDTGFDGGGSNDLWYVPLRFSVSMFTESIIRFGMR